MSKEYLAVIMPVYNEKDIIQKVILDWRNKLSSLGICFDIYIYNDGSKDTTIEVIDSIKDKQHIVVIDKINEGHGPTILRGYRDNSNIDTTWLFQIDSDNELSCDSFDILWNNREKYDFLVGRRSGRNQPLPRKIISFISRIIVYLLFGRSVWDVNSPYRLMRVSKFKHCFEILKNNTFAPNVAISGYAAFFKLKSFEHPIKHIERQTGEISLKKWKLFFAATKSFVQTILFRLDLSKNKY